MTIYSLLDKTLSDQFALSTEQLQQLTQYIELLQKWNRVFNLTAINQPEDIIVRHIMDSFSISPFLRGIHCLDVGSGAGLPGIPLAILHPELQWTLIDKNNKKILFINQVIAELNLTTLKAVHKNVADFSPAHCFNNIVSRAFGTIRLFAESTQHLLCHEGRLIAMKGKYPEAELADLPNYVKVTETSRFLLKDSLAERHILVLSISH